MYNIQEQMHSLDITCCFLGHFWRTTSAYAGDPGVPFSVLVGLLETGMNFMNVNKKKGSLRRIVLYTVLHGLFGTLK